MRNIIAVFAAALAHWLFGALWFTSFKAPWMAGLRMSQAEIEAAMQHPSPTPYLASLVLNLAMAMALLWTLRRMHAIDARHGAWAGAVLGVGIAAAAMMTNMAFELRTMPFILISAAYPALGCILMGVIVGAIGRAQEQVKSSAARA